MRKTTINRYMGLAFPRCSLQAEGLRQVVEWLAEKRVQVRWGVMVPEPSTAHDTQLDTLARDKLGALYGLSRSVSIPIFTSFPTILMPSYLLAFPLSNILSATKLVHLTNTLLFRSQQLSDWESA